VAPATTAAAGWTGALVCANAAVWLGWPVPASGEPPPQADNNTAALQQSKA
jgi:hypothetical protein